VTVFVSSISNFETFDIFAKTLYKHYVIFPSSFFICYDQYKNMVNARNCELVAKLATFNFGS